MRHTLAVRRAPRSLFSLVSEFDDLLTHRSTDNKEPTQSWFRPAADVEEQENSFLLTFDLPGVRKEDVKIDLNENQLTVRGERSKKTTKDLGKLHRIEREFGQFERTFSLPQGVENEKIEAHFENGVLQILVPKREAAKPKTIEIQSH